MCTLWGSDRTLRAHLHVHRVRGLPCPRVGAAMTATLTPAQAAARESVAEAEAGHALAVELIGLGIPVISLPRALKGEDGEYVWPLKYTEWLADVKHVAKWKAGHGLAMIGGHGLDGIDVDTKHGASVDAERARLQKHGVLILGEVRTPSGGAHFYVLSSGLRSTNASHSVGIDTRMGTQDGQGRQALFMPGTLRPKYGGLGYTWVQPLDLDYVRACLGDPELRLTQTMAITAYMAEIGTLRPTRETVPTVATVSPEPISPMFLSQALQEDLRATDWPPSTSGVGRRAGRFMHLVGHCLRAGLTQGQALTLLTEWNADPARGSDKYTGRLPEQLAHCWAIAIADHEKWKASRAQSTGEDVLRTSPTNVQGTAAGEDVQGHAQEDEPLEDIPRTWLPIDLGKYFDGSHVPERPTVGRREDGICLLYAGRTHSISGESEHGKSLVAQAIAVQVLQDGGNVLYLDFEKSPGTVAERLQALGLRNGAQPAGFTYVGPQAGLGALQNSSDYRRLWSQPWTLIIIDGVTAAMGLIAGHVTGGPEAPWGHFYSQLPRRLAEQTGAAVVLIDHVTKSQGSENRYGYGSVHKLNAMTGVAFLCKAPSPPDIGRTGQVELIGTKDSESGLKRHCPRAVNHLWPAATFVFDSTRSTEDVAVTDWQILAPSASTGTRAAFRPTALMERASKYLEDESGPLSRTNLVVGIGGKKEYAVVALDVLISEATSPG